MEDEPSPPRRRPAIPFVWVAWVLGVATVVAVGLVAVLGNEDGGTQQGGGGDSACETARQEMVALYQDVRAAELAYIDLVTRVDAGTPAADLSADLEAATTAVSEAYDKLDAYRPPEPLQDDRETIRPSVREFESLAIRQTDALAGRGEAPGEAIAERLQNLYDVQPDPASIACD